MAYRGITDPFTPKTTRNERFAQMSRQEQLIEQKKREIQAKLEEQKKKEATEALKKFQSAETTKTIPTNKVNSPSTLIKSGRKTFWKSEQRWKKETTYTDDSNSKSGSVNIFNNDGSFLDQFRKLSGVKDAKSVLDDNTPHPSGFDLRSSGSNENIKRESDTDWGTWNAGDPSMASAERDQSSKDHLNNLGERDLNTEELLQNSDRLGTSHWFQSHTQEESSNWQGQSNSPPSSTTGPRPSSPYSPTRATTDTPQTPEKPSLPIINPIPQFQQPPILSTATLPPLTSAPPPNMLQRPPVHPYIPYTSPPPPIHTVPPTQLPPPTIPPPTLTSIPPASAVGPPTLPTSLSVPPPAPVLQHTIPPTGVPPTTPPALAPQILPPLLQQPPVGPPPLLPPQGLPPPGTLPPTVPTSVLANTAPVIQTAIPPPPIPAAVMSVTHTIPPPCMPLSVPGAAMAGTVSAAPGTGVSSAAPPPLVPDPAEEEATTHLARMVAQCGDDIEEIIKVRNPDDKNLWFLHSKNSTAYIQYRYLVDKFRAEMKKDEDENTDRKEEINSSRSEDLKTDFRNDPSISEYGSTKQEMKCDVSDEFTFKREIKREPLDDENSRHSEGKRSGDDSDEGAVRRRKRRSRWAPESDKVDMGVPAVATVGGVGDNAGVGEAATTRKQMLTKISRYDPALIQYVGEVFGTYDLSEDDWKKAEDHYKINLLYQDMMQKRKELERLQKQGRFKYEYDSDEETDGGTWEHRLRLAEMEATQLWADELTKKAEGKHHIGDFLPPDELERFMEKYSALKQGREPDLSDYKEFKLKEDNIGFQMLQKLGWSEGQGLGTDGGGIVDPVNKASTRPENQGLGLERPQDVSKGDDEYDAYRKRMMLAYRFRPNPLNNPRRPYY